MSARFLIIIQAADVSRANAAAKQYFDPRGGELTFTVPLFAADAADDSTPTHYVCSAQVSAGNVPLLQSMAENFAGSHLLSYELSQSSFYADTLASLGLRTAKPQLA